NGEFVYYDASKNAIVPALQLEGFAGKMFSNSVSRIYYDKSGVVWIGSVFRGIIKLVIQDNVFKQQDISSSDNYSRHEVRAVYYDRQGRQWISTQERRLVVKENGVTVTLSLNSRSLDQYSINAYCILEDSK